MQLRLSNFEYSSLQEAYGGIIISKRITIVRYKDDFGRKRFDHEDWVSIRYGSGMAWKRCFAVVEPSTLKRKCSPQVGYYFMKMNRKEETIDGSGNQRHSCCCYISTITFID